MTSDSQSSLDPLQTELDALILSSLARYRPILPPRAIRHFRGVVRFLLETHAAPRRWCDELRRAGAADPAPAIVNAVGDPAPIEDELVQAIAAKLGLRSARVAEADDRADVVLHDAEAGVRFVVEASFPEPGDPVACRRALRRFVDLTLASLFAGLVAALLRRFDADPKREEFARLGKYFLGALALFQRLELAKGDAPIFGRYFRRSLPVRAVAAKRARPVAEEQEDVTRFLEKLGAFVDEEGPVVEREIKIDPAKLTPQSAPWATALLGRALIDTPGRSSKRQRKS